MSDRIAVINQGRIEQIGTPIELYDRPATRFVASFIGEANLFQGAGRGHRRRPMPHRGGRLAAACAT